MGIYQLLPNITLLIYGVGKTWYLQTAIQNENESKHTIVHASISVRVNTEFIPHFM